MVANTSLQIQAVGNRVVEKSGLLQRQCACGQHTNGGPCSTCEARSDTVPPIVHEVLRSPGQPLDTASRAFFEPRFAHDFSRVRVHTDARSAASAEAVNAAAYTVGRDIVFAAGQYSPQTKIGRGVLGHELAHTIQNGMATVTSPLQLGAVDSPLEKEAHAIASSVSARHSVNQSAAAAAQLWRITRDEALAIGQSLDTRYPGWLNSLPDCPCTFAQASRERSVWVHSFAHDLTLPFFHPGASTQVRSAHGYQSVPGTSHGQQCCYDSSGNLITEGPGAGTPDSWSPITNYDQHQAYDVATFNQLGWRIYDQYWRPNTGGCSANAGGGRRVSSGRYRIVGAFDELDLFIISIPFRTVTEAENVLVSATGREDRGLFGGRGHYSAVEVIPANAAAVQLFGGNRPRYLPSYLLQPVP